MRRYPNLVVKLIFPAELTPVNRSRPGEESKMAE